jgi:hypothetical protein
MKARAPKVFKWSTVTQMVTVIKHTDGRTLALMVGSGGEQWSCTAAELPKGVKTGAAALDSHAHKIIGQDFADVVAAMDAGERFAREWVEASRPAGLCGCKEIGAGA